MPKMSPRWAREQNHPKGCTGCARAADFAKSKALGDGLDSATASYDRGGELHTVTVTRPKPKGQS
jgi:hypothetical protein